MEVQKKALKSMWGALEEELPLVSSCGPSSMSSMPVQGSKGPGTNTKGFRNLASSSGANSGRKPGGCHPRPAVEAAKQRAKTKKDFTAIGKGCVFFVASAFRPVWPGRCDLSFICIPQSARALDQEGVEPRQAVSPKAQSEKVVLMLWHLGKTSWVQSS